tara:strand:+ start:3644 stop:4372 length:729 start_codon:yes stop_codon:yes gene_type:complete
MSKANLLNWLKSTEIPLTVISKKTNISRATLYNWINGGEVRNKSYNKMYDCYKENIELHNKDIKLEMGENNMEAQYIIDLQKEKIERLESELQRHSESPFQSSLWNDIQFQMYSEVEITFTFPNYVGRRMTILTGKRYIKKFMGYNDKEIDFYWQIGKYYKEFKEHPIDEIIAEKSLSTLNERIRTLPTLFENLKHMMGNHYVPIPISFICKNGELLHTIAYNKIDWLKKKVQTKTEFIIDD